jgi:sialidase-1
MSKIAPGTPLDVERFFKLDILEPVPPGYVEPLIVEGEQSGHLWFVYSEVHTDQAIRFKVSADAGRTWHEQWTARDAADRDVVGFHISVMRLKSGGFGMIYSTPDQEYGHPGREDRKMVFYRFSNDGARTWSDPVRIDTTHSCCCTGHAMVLSSGRIVAPAFRWISPQSGNEAEDWNPTDGIPSTTFSYSFAHISDDEGKTWRRSLSELYISVNRAAWDLEEPAVVELRDGRLLMHLRAGTGRIYKSYSSDGGMSWTGPQPVHIASANAPCMIRRLPSTGELLMVWNQASRQEIVSSRCRIRLSSAISADEGQTWENFKNLEALDDVTEVMPPPQGETIACGPYEVYGGLQPEPTTRYHRAPGILRICYPTIAFSADEAAIAYDIGGGVLPGMGARLRVIPVEWFRN